jgi:ankyrin
VTKSGDQLSLRFYAFRENRLPFNVRVKDPNSEPLGRIAFTKEPKNNRQDSSSSSQAPQAPICNLNLCLPPDITPETLEMPEGREADFQTKVSFLREAGYGKFDTIHKADLKISDIGNLLGSDWVMLAHELEIPESDINIIKTEYPENEGQQAMVMLRFWLNTQGNKATGNGLERALRKCDREDIVNKCILNVELVTDESEKHVAEEALDMIKEAEIVPDKEENEEIIPEREYKQVQEELITEKMEKMTFESGADTSLVEAAAIASRELKEEEEKTKTELILKPETPALSTQQPSADLEPSFIHSDDATTAEMELQEKQVGFALLDNVTIPEDMTFIQDEKTLTTSKTIEEQTATTKLTTHVEKQICCACTAGGAKITNG